MKKYRIKEYLDEFTIEILISETTGFWLWEKTTSNWYPCDKWGYRIYDDDDIWDLADSKPYKTLDKANKQIEKWKIIKEAEAIYHPVK